MRKAILAFLLLAPAGCSDSTGPELRVEAGLSAADVMLANRTSEPIYYFLTEQNTAALIQWAACVDAACPSVGPGEAVTVPLSEVVGWNAEANVVLVYWWQAVTSIEGERVPGRIHARAVSR